MSLKIKDEIYFLLHCERNSDGTKNLILQGNDLILRNNKRLCDNDILKICYFLKNFDIITTLNICYNDITDTGFKILVNYFFKYENNLDNLNIAYCDITKDGIKYFCTNAKVFKVRNFRLNGNKIGEIGGQDLALFLNENKYIEFLDIAETDQTLSSIAYWMKILNTEQGTNKSIKVIDLSRIIPSFNRYNYNDEHLADSISTLLFSNQRLIEIHLQKCQLDGHDIEMIINGLKKNRTLLFLDIGYNNIGDHGIELLANHLRSRPSLVGLNVAGNGIKDTGARALSFNMPYSRIRLLDIGNNKISPAGILDILNTIKKSVQIRILNIWGNQFDNECNLIFKRMFVSGVLNPDFVDVKIYEVDGNAFAAYNPSDRYKHKYYCELDYNFATMLKIKKNIISKDDKSYINFKFYPTIPRFKVRERKEHDWLCQCCLCKI